MEEKDPIDITADEDPIAENSSTINQEEYEDENEGESSDGDDEDEEESDLEEQDADENENSSVRAVRAGMESESENEPENQEEASLNCNDTTGLDGSQFFLYYFAFHIFVNLGTMVVNFRLRVYLEKNIGVQTWQFTDTSEKSIRILVECRMAASFR